jgi:cyclohexa-1,5-dienecarbonyl-CoA hydratase
LTTNQEFEFVRYALRDGVAKISLARPPANVMNIEMLVEMEKIIRIAAEAEGVRTLVIDAQGKLFSAGVDVADHTHEKVGEMIPLFNRVCVSLAEFPVPTIAAIQGHVLGGGCELVICCDFAIMVEGARIGQPEIRLASVAPIAALRLPEMVGPRWSAWILFSGEQLNAETAHQIGLVDQVVPIDQLTAAVEDRVQEFATLSTAALRHNKRALLMATGDWRAKIPALENLYLNELMASEDAQEGLDAFLEKREPIWKNR